MKDEAGVNEIEQDKKKALSPPPFTVSSVSNDTVVCQQVQRARYLEDFEKF